MHKTHRTVSAWDPAWSTLPAIPTLKPALVLKITILILNSSSRSKAALKFSYTKHVIWCSPFWEQVPQTPLPCENCLLAELTFWHTYIFETWTSWHPARVYNLFAVEVYSLTSLTHWINPWSGQLFHPKYYKKNYFWRLALRVVSRRTVKSWVNVLFFYAFTKGEMIKSSWPRYISNAIMEDSVSYLNASNALQEPVEASNSCVKADHSFAYNFTAVLKALCEGGAFPRDGEQEIKALLMVAVTIWSRAVLKFVRCRAITSEADMQFKVFISGTGSEKDRVRNVRWEYSIAYKMRSSREYNISPAVHTLPDFSWVQIRSVTGSSITRNASLRSPITKFQGNYQIEINRKAMMTYQFFQMHTKKWCAGKCTTASYVCKCSFFDWN